MEAGANRKVVLFIAMMGSFLTPFLGSSVNIALPSIARDFSMNSVALNWVPSSYLLASAIFVVPFGRLADIYGRKRIYLYGVGVFTVATLLCGLAFSDVSLIIFRALQGIGGAAMFGTGVAILTSVYPPGERGKVLGYNVAVVYIGLSVGPLIGGLLTQYFGWRSIFFVTVPIGIAVAALLRFKLEQEWAEAKGETFDYKGAVIYGISLFGIMSGLSFAKSGWLGPVLMAAGVAGIAAFILWETKVKSPVLEMALFKNNKILTFSTLAALINYSATSAVGYLLSLYLQYVKGLPPQAAGWVLMAQPVVQAVFSPLSGRLSDRLEPQKVSSIGMGMSAVGLLMFIFLKEETEISFIVAALAFLGFGFALFSSPNTNAVMSSVEKRYYGVTSGLLGTSRLVGQTFSMGITALVFSIYMGTAQITRESHPYFIGSVQAIFIIMSVLCVAGIFSSLARGKMHS